MMRGRELAEAMVVVVDRLVNACKGTSALDTAIETTVDKIDPFNGKDTLFYVHKTRGTFPFGSIPWFKTLWSCPISMHPRGNS